MSDAVLLLTCEHASCAVPEQYEPLFSDNDLLWSHRGWDIGASHVAQAMARLTKSSLILAQYTRLLVDLNRSASRPDLFSSISKKLSQDEQQRIMTQYYLPYRSTVKAKMKKIVLERKRIHHISVHSFVPVLNGQRRNCDIGLLYDPSRNIEKSFALAWKKKLASTGLKVRCNYPYRGISDGFPTSLRKEYSSKHYSGIELEINQRFFDPKGQPKDAIVEKILLSLSQFS